MYKLSTRYGEMYMVAVAKLSSYIRDHDIKALVIGISGGVDSALVAALAKSATEYPYKDIPVIGRSITIESNKPEEVARAKAIGEAFCNDFAELDLTKAYCDLIGQMDMAGDGCTDMEAKIALGNIKARIRMTQLYHLAGINKGLVLSTDNYTELLLGFWTLHGDVGDYGMVQNLWKTEVYGLTKFIADIYRKLDNGAPAEALEKCIDAVPTDGLGITDSDLDQLGASSYNEVDKILIDYLNFVDRIDHPVIDRYERTHFKRENPVNIPRKELIP
jgi:NAD+ synthetase